MYKGMYERVSELYENIIKPLLQEKEQSKTLSNKAFLESIFAKLLIIAIWSEFENDIKNFIEQLVSICCNKNNIKTFVRRSVLERRIYDLFDPRANNINRFLGYLDLREINIREDGMRDFIYFLRTRNEIVHENMIKFVVNDTPEEVYEKFKRAHNFWDNLKNEILQFMSGD